MTNSYQDKSWIKEIDRLVDGELPGSERQALLKRLEHEPDGWRRCALAFLEDQAFHESLGEAMKQQPTTPLPVPSRSSGIRNILKIAAAVLAAFALGWSVKGERRVEVAVEKPAPEVREVSTVAAEPPARIEVIIDPEAEQKRAWELAGYSLERVDRYVAVDTKDGRPLAIPIREYSVQYIGDRTY